MASPVTRNEIPQDLWESVCEYLEPKEIMSCRAVSRAWREATARSVYQIHPVLDPKNGYLECLRNIERERSFVLDDRAYFMGSGKSTKMVVVIGELTKTAKGASEATADLLSTVDTPD